MPDEYSHAPSGSIVVGHDASEHSARALQQALTLAEAFAAPLVVVRAWELDKHVPEYTQMLSGPGSFPEVTDALRAILEAECEETVSEHPSVAVRYLAALGSPAVVLTSVAEQARLLVVGSRGHGGLAGLLLGSVADRCVLQASCPVLLIRPPAETEAVSATPPQAETGHAGPEVALEIEPGSVVVGHDGSANSEKALEVGFEYALTLGLPLAIVRTWSIDHLPRGLLWKEGYVASFDEINVGVREELIADVGPLAERHEAVTVSHYATLGDPGESLVRASQSAALLIVGNRGRGGFGSLLLGSVSAYCAHRADCPTLIVPR
ncbi:universal stress protein [Leifsonia sp. A12D58]|uniref:universal stress protein n=1 Tax=Leifsonia sp. A12D58 TaxID=3397674 RepID=UPI0039DF6F6D